MRAGRTPRYESILTLVLGLTFGIVFFDRNALNYLMPFVLEEIELSNTQIGMLASGLALTWALSGIVVGRVADRISSRKPILVAAIVVFSLSSFVTGLATSFLMLLGARLLMGLSEGPVLPVSQSLMAEASSPERRGLNMGLMQNVLSNLMGSLVAPLVVVALANAFGWRAAFFVSAVPGLIAAALVWLLVKEPGKPERGARTAEAGSFRAALKSRNVRLCVAISGLMVGWMITGWVFLPIYFTATLGFTPTQMSILMSVLGLSGAFAGFFVPALSDRYGRRIVVAAGCALGVLTPVAALYGGGGPAALLTLFVATGWMAGGTFSIFMATIPAESAATGHVTTAMALIMGTGELLGGAAAPTIVGWFTDRLGPGTPLFAEILFASGAFLLALSLTETAPRQIAGRGDAAQASG